MLQCRGDDVLVLVNLVSMAAAVCQEKYQFVLLIVFLTMSNEIREQKGKK